MRAVQIHYDPDGWSRDLHQWWAPLAGLAAGADVTSADWLRVLGVEEFFDQGLLGQTQVLTSWVCLAAAAAAAAAARTWAGADGAGADGGTDAGITAVTALELAMALQRLRWRGRRVGEGTIVTHALVDLGRAALRAGGFPVPRGGGPTALWLAAGWLAHVGSAPPGPGPAGDAALPSRHAPVTAQHAVAHAAHVLLDGRPGAGPLDWGTAHLAERFAAGELDAPAHVASMPGTPAEACANVLLVPLGQQPDGEDAGAAPDGRERGRFEARRQRSLLAPPPGTPVPDLARLAFLHADGDFAVSVGDAFTAAHRLRAPARPGELVSWSLQLPGCGYPLAERAVRGASASLGAYVAFRALADPRVAPDSTVAFTGQVAPDGQLRPVGHASAKIAAAHGHRLRTVVYPGCQAWADPSGALNLVGVDTAEDAVNAATEPLRGMRAYLEAACRLIEPEPWLHAWLAGKGPVGAQMPLLDVMARHLRRRRPDPVVPGNGPGVAVLVRQPAGAGLRPPGPDPREPEVAPCPAHLLARTYPDYSFAISAGGGCGKTMAAKRIVADAARHALESLRAGPAVRPSVLTIPLYLPLGDLPANWDELVRASIEVLPGVPGSRLETAAALAGALAGRTSLTCRALVVVDGTHRTRSDDDLERNKVREFVALIAAGLARRATMWQPAIASQVVLCGRNESRRHQRAVEALRRERPGWMATMGLDPLSDSEIDRFVSCLSGRPVPHSHRSRSLVSNPLLLALSVVAGQPEIDSDPADVFDRGINVLLHGKSEHRRCLAEIAFRAASVKLAPMGGFTLADIAAPEAKEHVVAALAAGDTVRAWALALDHDERRAFEHAEQETHLVTAAGRGWRFFHDRAFAFLAADRVARRALESPGAEDDVFGPLGPHLGDPLWADTIEATGRLLELQARVSQG